MDFQAIDIVRQAEQEAEQLIEQAKQDRTTKRDQASAQARQAADEILEAARIKARQLEDVAVKIGEEEARPILEASRKRSDMLRATADDKLTAVAQTIVERILG